MIDFRLEIEQNLQPIPERMRLVRLWNISWGKVEEERKLFGFIGKVVFDFGQQKNTFSGRKRVRKYPTILYGMREKILKYALYLWVYYSTPGIVCQRFGGSFTFFDMKLSEALLFAPRRVPCGAFFYICRVRKRMYSQSEIFRFFRRVETSESLINKSLQRFSLTRNLTANRSQFAVR